jgi:hypothetical protein
VSQSGNNPDKITLYFGVFGVILVATLMFYAEMWLYGEWIKANFLATPAEVIQVMPASGGTTMYKVEYQIEGEPFTTETMDVIRGTHVGSQLNVYYRSTEFGQAFTDQIPTAYHIYLFLGNLAFLIVVILTIVKISEWLTKNPTALKGFYQDPRWHNE